MNSDEADRNGSLPRVLVVEDEPSQARLIELIFARSEFPADVKLAYSLTEARELLAGAFFDLVITDLNLSDGQGVELLPPDPARPAFPVILLSGQGDEKIAVQAIKSGAADYIVKTEESMRALPKTVAGVLREWGRELQRREMGDALRQKQLELEENHRQLQELFQLVCRAKKEWELSNDCVNDLIIRVDENWKICRVNRAVCTLTGQTFQVLLGKDFAQVFGELPIGENDKGQIEFHHQASGRWFFLNVYSLDNTEIGPGWVITAHDYTTIRELNVRLEESNCLLGQRGNELAQAYDELKNTQELVLRQEKMATIGQLAAGVAHEINNPMGFILSNLGTLGKYLERLTGYLASQDELISRLASPEQLAEIGEQRRAAKIDSIMGDLTDLLNESLEGGYRVRKIVGDLKGFSHQADENPELTDLNTLIEGTLSFVWNEIKYKATLIRDFAELQKVSCYPRLISQVLTNLLLNAVQAIEKQGEITVRTWVDGEYVCLSVADTGNGIPESVVKRIFDPFFTTKELGVGTGLGLSISYDIIKQHGGELLVETKVGEGSTFTIRLLLGVEPESRRSAANAEKLPDNLGQVGYLEL